MATSSALTSGARDAARRGRRLSATSATNRGTVQMEAQDTPFVAWGVTDPFDATFCLHGGMTDA